ncbi:MAG: lipopolysaccharide biosynthesis protein [Cetobacterium sp.]
MKIRNKFLEEILFNYISKAFLMGVGFILIPLVIRYLGSEKYGIWVTVMTLISWAQISDFGIGNGLRNKITENYANKNIENLKKYVSTAYITLTGISVLIFFLGILIFYILNFQNVFNTNISEVEIKICLIITLFSFSFNFILGLSKNIANAIHKSYLVGFSQVFYSILLIIMILLLFKIQVKEKLISISLIYFISTTIANIVLSIKIFQEKYFQPKLINFDKNLVGEILGVGIKFFIIQVSLLILFSTDSIIITKLLGPEQVTKYSLIEKIFGTIVNLYSILLVGLWSKVSKIETQGKLKSINKLIFKFKLTLIPVFLVTVVISLFFNKIIFIWTKENIYYEFYIRLIFFIYTMLMVWSGISLNIVNGLGKLKLQMWLYIIAAILNIPLSIYFIKYLNLGIMGAKLATLICLLPIGILIPYQVKKILNN